jgi:TetR/AcrR family transcriptional repressor of bet genes
MAAMIDGFYIRCAMQDSAPDPTEAKRLVADYLDMSLEFEMAGRTKRVANAGAGG